MDAFGLSHIISIISVGAAIFFGYKAYNRTSVNDVKEIAKLDGAIEKDIDYIKEGIHDIKAWQNSHDKQFYTLVERVVILERDLKSAWKRIDDYE